jgi:outer membrane protein assembly factor BamB
MSTVTQSKLHAPRVTGQASTGDEAKPRVSRTWLMVTALVAFWCFYFIHDSLELSMLMRFLTRMGAYAALLLVGLGWWLTNGRLSWSERLAGLGIGFGIWTLAGFLCDKSVNHFALGLMALPWWYTIAFAWLVLAGKQTSRLRLSGLAALAMLTFGVFTLFRWDGLDGAQHSVVSWRWTPTPEQQFLAAKSTQDSTTASKLPTPTARTLTIQSGDWPEFRGLGCTGQVHGFKIATDWQANPPKLVWRERVGPAWSGMTIVDGLLFTQEQRGDQEAVICYDATTGKEVWVHEDATRFFEALSGSGPRGTPTFVDGLLYTHGATGKLNCLKASTGKQQWSRDIVADSGAPVPQWGHSCSPLVTDGLVVIFAGGDKGKSLLAYDAKTGEPAWTVDAGKDSYSSPQFALLAGQRQILYLSDRGLLSFDLEGKPLWQHVFDQGVISPVVQPQLVGDDSILIQNPFGVSVLTLKTEAGGSPAVKERWASTKLKPSLNDFVVHDGAIYGFDDGIFGCLDLATGDRRWKRGRYGHGQVLLLPEQSLLVILSEKGEVALVSARADKHEELGRFNAITGKTWNHPTLVRGRLYVRNDEEMACYELPTR